MSLTGPLQIDQLVTPGGGVIGMVHCPGRCTPPWQRDLAADLAVIEAWPADILLSLIETHEFARLGVAAFPEAVAATRLRWHHVPIRDMATPGGDFDRAWTIAGPDVLGALRDGGRVVIHCAAGLGRTGTIAAKLLMALGVDGKAAIAAVRHARPGTIETREQEAFVLDTRLLGGA